MSLDEYTRPTRRRRLRPQRRSTQLGTSSLLFIGLIAGLIGALIYAWLVNPVIYTNATPASFNRTFREEFLFLVSQNYAATGDWARAEQRLALLGESDEVTDFAATELERYLRQGKDPRYVQNLAQLAARLGVEGDIMAFFAPQAAAQATPVATAILVPTITPTLLPTLTPTALPTQSPQPTNEPTRTPRPTSTPQPTFRLLSQARLCRPDESVFTIEVEVVDAFLDPLAGIEVLVSWDGGEDHFFTGFKPALGPGRGDYEMVPERSYQVVLAGGSPTVSGLRLERCDSREGGLDGGWRLTFQKLTIDESE